MDKRTGKRTLTERTPIADVGLPSFTLEEAVDFVVKVKRANNLKERTISGYIQNMQYFTEWITVRHGEITIQDVTTDMLRGYILWCSDEKEYYGGHPFKSDFDRDRRGISPASVNVRIRVLKTFFSVLYEEEVISRNPARNVSLMRQDVDTVAPLTEDELRRFMKAPDQKQWAQWRDAVIMTLILDAGLRLGEICSLEKSEVDFVKKHIVLPASKNKNRKSRVLPLSTETLRMLKQLITESAQHFDTTHVFTTNYGEQLSEKTIQKSFDKYAEKAKLGRSVSPHVLRHNFATMAAENGMSIFHLQKIMGHADIQTTRKYVQISESSIADEHRRFSPLLRLSARKGSV
ncbi:tyrosine-type recombinase/integrase [Paenibacillus odorifer]|uniref:tyrosine-type recombinase/integrase n=1 Tax=Paenibacillus odorifer TaxID=189426 RepID=UPI000BA18E02|nr:tyrosine-type recombinase/integrase [Paenibacillus odorifer]OZQ66537.1 integrase [Paenibacillus odorifer]